MTNTLASARIVRDLLGLTAALAVLASPSTRALPTYGIDCTGCHSISRNGMALLSFQTTTNLGAGLRKVFQVTRGQTAVIQLSVTNNNGGNYGLNINNLGAAGANSSSDHMACTPDATWTSQSSGTYFTQGPINTSPKVWTFNLAVGASTPPDYYTVQTIMAGNGTPGKWSQQEAFYVQVLAAAPPAPTILSSTRSGTSFSLQVATTSGFTYFLEYKTNLSALTWNLATQTAGDGTVRTLTDPAATDPERIYHVRVQ